MALSTISWEIGFVIGPAIGGFILDRQALALWPLAAAVCLLAGAGALALERGMPPRLRLTPA
jgi:predicted MFS family arabinose efflux permease